MRKLYLLRHAKSSWDDPALGDFDRPLTPRGEAAARRMAHWLSEEGIRPGLVLVSAAARTRATFALIEPALEGVPVSYEEGLYEAGKSRLIERLRGLDDHLGSVILIGHNPGLARLAEALCGGHGDAAALAKLAEKFPTGALAVLETDVSRWAALQPGCCRLAEFVRPREV